MKIYCLRLLLLFVAGNVAVGESVDATDIADRFCYPDGLKNTRRSCECNDVSAPPWGLRSLNVDCSYKNLQAADLSNILPVFAETLDLSWNILERVPSVDSDSLQLLNLLHNNISALASQDFIKLPNLRELYLGWNSIRTVAASAFEGLSHLQVLDLSHNNLHALPPQTFAPLLQLDKLNLSWNRQFNVTSQPAVDFYRSYGLTLQLSLLKLEACGLTTLLLPANATLSELSLRHNHLRSVPPQLPHTLAKLDMSENYMEALLPTDTANLTHLQEFYLEDMPFLQSVAEDALMPLAALQQLSFQNSRRLGSVHALAFGANTTLYPALRGISFRGTVMRTFNRTLEPVFRALATLDLNGLPLQCDCQLLWVKELPLETNGRCYKPSRLRGMLLSNARAGDFSCDTWPRWVYGCIILGLLIICAAGIYLIVMGLRPHRGVMLRRKVGAGSPYARVTIEPNRQEHN